MHVPIGSADTAPGSFDAGADPRAWRGDDEAVGRYAQPIETARGGRLRRC